MPQLPPRTIRCRLILIACLIFLCPYFSVAQSIEEKFDHWPTNLKINGTIIACGSSIPPGVAKMLDDRISNIEQEKPVEQKTIKDIFSTDQAYPLKILVSDNQTTQTITPTDSQPLTLSFLKRIESANLVVIGSTKRANKADTVRIKKLLSHCKKMVDAGGTLCVFGSIVEQLGDTTFDQIEQMRVESKGMNLIPDAVLATRYDDEQDRRKILQSLSSNPKLVGIGIEPDTAIILRGRKIRIMGNGRATFLLMANEDKPLRVQHVREPESRRANPYTTIVDLTAWRRDAIDRTLAPFPPAKPPKPHVENGALFIVGGGGMPEGLLQEFVDMAGGKKARIVYVPCSESDQEPGPHRIVSAFKQLGVESATFIHTKDRAQANTDDAFMEPLKEATGIWFGGGRQWNFSDSYYGTRTHQLMKNVLSKGGVIGGSSAGASIQARYMCRANPVANFDIMAPGYERGLGFIGGIAIDQHFSQRGRQKDMTQLVDRYPQLLGIGIDEGTAIIVQKSMGKVVGKGKVHFYDRTQPVIPGKDDFIALPKESVFDLATRTIVKDGRTETQTKTSKD